MNGYGQLMVVWVQERGDEGIKEYIPIQVVLVWYHSWIHGVASLSS